MFGLHTASFLYAALCLFPYEGISFQVSTSRGINSYVRMRQSTGDRMEPMFDQSSVPDIPTSFNTDDDVGYVNIPSTGISISDEIEAAQKDKFVTDLIPIKGLIPGAAAQLVTISLFTGSFEPVRYLMALSQPSVALHNVTSVINENDVSNKTLANNQKTDYVMVDIPPYSDKLVDQINEFLSQYNGQLRMIVSTNRNSIHYDEAPAIYSTRRADLDLWNKAFPGVKIVAYRLDIPRDCRYAITQVLDGYGPFALEECDSTNTFNFVEMSRPLTVVEWDHSESVNAFSGKGVPDDSAEENESSTLHDLYSPTAIRDREAGRRILAIYTPGYSYGSICYIFPESNTCCSGYAIPVEDNRYDENVGIGGSTGPALDCRGYISNSKNRKRQMESAENLVNVYIDRFKVVLPARGDPFFLDDNVADRKKLLLETISQYAKIGDIYERLGIISSDDVY